MLELLSEVVILLDTRDQILSNAKEIIRNFSNPDLHEITLKNQVIDNVYTHDLDLGSITPTKGFLHAGEIITDKKVLRFTQMYNETKANLQLQQNRQRVRREPEIQLENYSFDSIDVDELYVEYINDIPIDEFIFIENGRLTLDGTVVVNQTIDVENVDNYNENTYFVGDEQMLSQENTKNIIDGDLKFEEINGIKWSDLIQQIMMKNLPNQIADIKINGVCHILLYSELQYLFANNLSKNTYFSTTECHN